MKNQDKIKNLKNIKRGKRGRRSGGNFEKLTRKDLEEKGWIVSRWQNNIDFRLKDKTLSRYIFDGENGKLIQAKPSKFRLMQTGFPDFMAFRLRDDGFYEIIGIECKVRKYLDELEKKKCRWLLKNRIFSRILIAYRVKEDRKYVVKYVNFTDMKSKKDEK